MNCIMHYEEGLKLYRDREFKKAKQKFVEALFFEPDDNPSKLFILRCDFFLENSCPHDWDGVFDMATK